MDTDKDSILITHREICPARNSQAVIDHIKRNYTKFYDSISFYNVCYIFYKNDFSKHVFAIHQNLDICMGEDVQVELLEVLYNPRTDSLFYCNGVRFSELADFDSTLNGKNVCLDQLIMCYLETVYKEKLPGKSFLEFIESPNLNDIYDYRQIELY